jgi:hypothetical protein
MRAATENYWEQNRIDPANCCPHRGEYPHSECEIELREGGHSRAAIYGVCHGHKTYWLLQVGGTPAGDWPQLHDLADYACADGDSAA